MSHRPMYTILGARSTDTQAEIKRAYHREALKYHPDKNTEDTTEKFRQIQSAYEVLSDPSKRRIYDKYGEQGLHNMDMPGISEAAMLFGLVNIITFGAFILLVIFVCVIVFLAFVCVRIERHSWSWTSVFIPLYVVDVIIGFACLVVIAIKIVRCVSKRDRVDTSYNDTCASKIFIRKVIQEVIFFGTVSIPICYITFNVLVSIGLKKRSAVNWCGYFVPINIAEILVFAITFIELFTMRELLQKHGVYNVTYLNLVIINVLTLLAALLRLLQIFIIPVKIIGYISYSWWLIALPFYVHQLLSFIRTIVIASAKSSSRKLLNDASFYSVCPICFTACLFHGMLLAFVIMIVAKLEGSSIPLEYCFIPIFLMLAAATVTLCFFSCSLIIFANSMSDDIGNMENDNMEENYNMENVIHTTDEPVNPADAVAVSSVREYNISDNVDL